MDDDHDSSRNEANGEEPILISAVLFVVDDQVILVTLEQKADLIEADTVLGLVLTVLRRVPLDPHPRSLRH